MGDEVRMVAMSLIDRPVVVARDNIDMDRVRELAESIRERGLLQPIILRSVNGRFEVVAGDRRFLAHKFLGLEEIKAVVQDLNDEETIIVRAIENIQRENLTHCEEGRGYEVLAKVGGLTPHQISKKVGKSFETVRSHLKLVSYPDYVQSAVEKKHMSLAVAHVLCEIVDEEFLRYYVSMAAENGINEKVARLWVDDFVKSKQGTYYEQGVGVPVVDGEGEARKVYMTCEACDGAVEMGHARSMLVCPVCRKKIKGQLNV